MEYTVNTTIARSSAGDPDTIIAWAKGANAKRPDDVARYITESFTPCDLANDVMHSSPRNAEPLRDGVFRHVLCQCANLAGIIHRQFGRRAAVRVLRARNRLQMRWIAARAITAKMIYLASIGDRAGELFVGDSVNESAATIANDKTVPAIGNRTLPKPASCVRINPHTALDRTLRGRMSTNEAKRLSLHDSSPFVRPGGEIGSLPTTTLAIASGDRGILCLWHLDRLLYRLMEVSPCRRLVTQRAGFAVPQLYHGGDR